MGFTTITGTEPDTVSVAAPVVAEPKVLVNTARNCLPLSATAAVNEYVVAVAPLISLNDAPLLLLTCHCTVGDGFPLAAAVNVTGSPAATL